MCRFPVIGLLCAVSFPASAFAGNAPQKADPVLRIKAALSSTESHVVGSPDPPPPYRVARVLPKLRLTLPVGVANEPGSRRLLFIDQDETSSPARLCRTTDDPQSGEFETLIDFDDSVAYSIAFHPQFAQNGFMYVGGNGPGTDDEKTKMCWIRRYTIDRASPFALDTKSAVTIIEWKSNGHNGAAIAFGLDRMLYVTSGDGTSDSDTNLTGQGLDHLLAKVLRIDVDHPDQGRAYSVPADNPFVGQDGVRPETWAYGFRNPWRMTVDPKTGNLWVGNNGQDLWEQIYLVQRGANYGWSVYEGGHEFYPDRRLGPTPVSMPTFDHSHAEARSLTGGVVYYGRRLPDLHGAYIYGDYSTGRIWGAKVDDRTVVWHRELADSTLQISDFAIDSDGELLIADHQGDGKGGFYRLEPNPPPDIPAQFPRTLSETGLFESVAEHRLQPGAIPYSVNAPLWSDGALKERYLVLPAADPTIKFMLNRGWDFPDGTVLVKSFALETSHGDPGNRRWIETRLLTRQQGEWVGYSYRWNDEQTDATLVARDGADQTFTVSLRSGDKRQQAWRFPSRTECMVCHSRAAQYVLGLSTLQMNRGHDYGGVVENQLQVLDRLGVLRPDWLKQLKAGLQARQKREGREDSEIQEEVKRLTDGLNAGDGTLSALLASTTARFDRLVDPYDDKHNVSDRARSYLHANCAQCHVAAGGGNAQIDLEFTTSLDKTKLIDVDPLHDKYGITDAKLVAPGNPDRSVLLHRVAMRGRGQMPQLATFIVDDPAVRLIRDWITQLKPAKKPD
jgi:glucose/arabinose dehydrogenase/mono/diheme cytochrome c family protein